METKMGWTQKIEYVDGEVAQPVVVKKQVWDGEKFVSMTQYRSIGVLSSKQKDWLFKTFGQKGSRWNYTDSGKFYVMDEQVYMMFKLKWSQNLNQEV